MRPCAYILANSQFLRKYLRMSCHKIGSTLRLDVRTWSHMVAHDVRHVTWRNSYNAEHEIVWCDENGISEREVEIQQKNKKPPKPPKEKQKTKRKVSFNSIVQVERDNIWHFVFFFNWAFFQQDYNTHKFFSINRYSTCMYLLYTGKKSEKVY